MATAHFNVSVSVRLSVRRESSDVLFFFILVFLCLFWGFHVYRVTVAVIKFSFESFLQMSVGKLVLPSVT